MVNHTPVCSIKPGEVRNVKGANAPGHYVRRALTQELKAIGAMLDESSAYGTITKIQALAFKFWEMALAGNPFAMETVIERLDGKIPQAQVLMGDEDGGPVKYERIERVIVKADAANTNSGSVPTVPAARAV